jgi:hypothetical protein
MYVFNVDNNIHVSHKLLKSVYSLITRNKSGFINSQSLLVIKVLLLYNSIFK